MKRKILTTALALMALTFVFDSCDEKDDIFYFPTADFQFIGNNGMVVRDTAINIESRLLKRTMWVRNEYKILLGTSKDSMLEVKNPKGTIELKPFTQYFWCAISCNEDDWSEPSETMTFYCIPTLKLSSENGAESTSAVISWNENKARFENKKLTMTGEKTGDSEMFDVADNDSQYAVTYQQNTQLSPLEHDYDDEHGILYEPILYKFKLTADAYVGDSVFPIESEEITEIMLDNSKYVRDHEFNVYRLVKIGDQIWLADNLRDTTNCKNSYRIDFCRVQLCTGEPGVLYKGDYDVLAPKGFHVAIDDDWAKMEKYYGCNMDIVYERYLGLLGIECFDHVKNMYESDIDMFQNLASAYGWRNDSLNRNNNNVLNIKPFYKGAFTPDGVCTYFCCGSIEVRVLSEAHYIRGVTDYELYMALRCVKDE